MINYYYEQKLEPIYPTERQEGKHIIRTNYLYIAEETFPDSCKTKWYAIYEVTKPFDDLEGNRLETGFSVMHQVLLPHQNRGISFSCPLDDLIKEAIAKNYLEFKGVEKMGEEE